MERPKSSADTESHSPSELGQLDKICIQFEDAWRANQAPQIEAYLARFPLEGQAALLWELIALEFEYRCRAGETPSEREYLARFPGYASAVSKFFLAHRAADPNPTGAGKPSCSAAAGTAEVDSLKTADWRPPPDVASSRSKSAFPSRRIVGRYQLQRILGEGAFGAVYLAQDTELGRDVAVKFLDAGQFSSQSAFEMLQNEARSLARLKHPAIVTVYDVGRDETGVCYIVMEYVEGGSLKEQLLAERLSARQIAAGMAAIAEGLYHAHTQGLVHRDLKPGNVLLDREGHFHVADFGLAIHEDTQRWLEGEIAGTPAYMAPEQVRGETHRLDGRTDVWGLGAILYELLALERPFSGATRTELYENIQQCDPKLPRALDDAIPRELERICLKCLSKRMADRYANAGDLANDLRQWLRSEEEKTGGELRFTDSGSSWRGGPRTAASVTGPTRIIPRGLRSFSGEDQEFFLDLLPGPRGRDGLPEGLRFWKSRLEDIEDGDPCAVMYGPSGCGKSSLVKAGLLPRLAEHVVTVYVESSAEGTEDRLLNELRNRCRQLPADASLPRALAALRGGRIAWPDRKVLVVLDQFEQWLHGRREPQWGPLLKALRQCDGRRLQCLLMVRDDFWLATTRFTQALEFPLLEGRNIALVDLFDLRHARRVLTKFGQALEALPQRASDLTPQHERFLDRALAGLEQDGKIVPVRLSLFADMVKSRSWLPKTLDEVGGAQGLGVAFLDESFSARTANPQHRRHQRAAQAVLRSLLPDDAVEIKGRVRSRAEMLATSGYAASPAEFDDLMRILDAELRMVTPTEAATLSKDGEASPPTEAGYQLSHDYLVAPLREWLTRTERQSWRGRARLCLEQRAAQWKSRRERRYLPSPGEYVAIAAGVPGKRRSRDERDLMRAATRHYGRIAILAACLAGVIVWGAWEANGRLRGRGASEAVLAAKPSELDQLIREKWTPYRRWAAPRLTAVASDETADADERLNASLALASSGPGQADYLRVRLLDCSWAAFPLVREALEPQCQDLRAELWSVFRDSYRDRATRFHAGLALAGYWQDDSDWTADDASFLAASLIRAAPDDQPLLRRYLQPAAPRLVGPLRQRFADESLEDPARVAAAGALAEFAKGRTELLAELLADATASQYRVLFPLLAARQEDRDSLLGEARRIVMTQAAPGESAAGRVRHGRRRAGAAISLLRLNAPREAIAILAPSSDPEASTQFIHGLRQRDVPAAEAAQCLELASSPQARYAMLLALGDYPRQDVPPDLQERLARLVLEWYRCDPDAGVHSACGWLLAQWGRSGLVAEADRAAPAADPSGRRCWFVETVAGDSLRFAVFMPSEFVMGAPKWEEGYEDEAAHSARIQRPFALADREVTRRQYERFRREMRDLTRVAPSPDHAMMGVRWYDAVLYCRWLTEKAGMTESDQCYPPLEQWKQAAAGVFTNVTCRPERPGYRLPSETEWEYACRSGSATAFSFGSDRRLLGHYAWFLENAGLRGAVPGLLRPNSGGLFDMHGNALEWCDDVYGPYRTGEKRPGLAAVTYDRVLRGGGWGFRDVDNRSAYRHSGKPDVELTNYGFRLARTLVIKKPSRSN